MLKQVIDIKHWLARDADKPYSERLDRDRRIGSQLGEKSALSRVVAWWQLAATDNTDSVGERAEASRRFAINLLFIVGALVGLSLAGVAFAFNGSHPVNLFALFGVLIGLPLIFLCASLIAFFAPIPGIRNFLNGLNLGRWVGGWLDRRVKGEMFFNAPGSPSAAQFSRWQMSVFSQWFSVGYFLGVLSLAWLLIVFTDLAFGWSTTLQIEAQSVHSWFVALSLPWRSWLIEAVPSLALVEASQFYRLEDNIPAARVVQLGTWWPFVMMVIVVYGLLPRLSFLMISLWRGRVATVNLLLRDPEVVALLDRLTPPVIAYESPTEVATPIGQETTVITTSIKMAGNVEVIIWNQAIANAAAGQWLGEHWRGNVKAPVNLTVGLSDSKQKILLRSISRSVDNLVIFVKGWEPATLDFSDMLAAVREHLDADASIIIVPIAVNLAAVDKADRDIWAAALGSQCPGCYVIGAVP